MRKGRWRLATGYVRVRSSGRTTDKARRETVGKIKGVEIFSRFTFLVSEGDDQYRSHCARLALAPID